MLKRFYFSGLIISIFSFLVFIGCEKKGTEPKPDFIGKVFLFSRTASLVNSISFKTPSLTIDAVPAQIRLSVGSLSSSTPATLRDSIFSSSNPPTLPVKSLRDLTRVQIIIGTPIFLAFIALLTLYLWYAFQDVIVILKNYNFHRASRCQWTSCGLYYHDENDPLTKDCLSPLVSRPSFEKRSKGGTQAGCHYSIQVREIDLDRKPASDYLREFMERYTAFHVSKVWWKIITIQVGILLLIFGAVSLYELAEKILLK